MSTTLPPLLALAQGRRVRLRRAPTIRPKEVTLHTAVVATLRGQCAPEWLWTHIASGELIRDKATAAKLKQMGVRSGWPDFLLVTPCGSLRCLELKRKGERFSEDQENFSLDCLRRAVPYAVAHDIGEAVTALTAWGAIRAINGGAAHVV